MLSSLPLPQSELSRRANACISYAVRDFHSDVPHIMGRLVANETFLSAFARHADVDAFACVTRTSHSHADFTQKIRRWSGRSQVPVTWVGPLDHAKMQEFGTYFTPNCRLAYLARHRRLHDQRAYSICGLTHTISDVDSMHVLADLIVGPVQRWDALICTSKAGRSAVVRLTERMGEYLREHLGASRTEPLCRLPIIPLGVDSETLGNLTPADRAHWRGKLGIPEDEVVFLQVGRLDFLEKMNPTATYLALERAAQRLGRRLRFVQVGHFSDEVARVAFQGAARSLCPNVEVTFVADRSLGVWACGDIFTSLSDNIQETFGLTPVEAMAAGLPVVVSDWDGYRDTVRDGIDGITVPTSMPPPGAGLDLALIYDLNIWNTPNYVGNTALSVNVDVEQAAEAYVTLYQNRELRRRMGDAAKQRVHDTLDWRHVVRAYQELWAELAQIRESAEESAPRKGIQAGNAGAPDPYDYFHAHPTHQIGLDDSFTVAVPDPNDSYARVASLTCNGFGPWTAGRQDLHRRLLDSLTNNPTQTVRGLLADIPGPQQPRTLRALSYLAKVGILRFVPCQVESS